MSIGISSGDFNANMREMVNKYSKENVKRREEGKPLPVNELITYLQNNIDSTYLDEQAIAAQEAWLKGWISESEIEQEVPMILVEKISRLKREILSEKKARRLEISKTSIAQTGIILAVAILSCFFVQSYDSSLLNFEQFSIMAVLESGLAIFGFMFASAIIVVGANLISELLNGQKKALRVGVFVAVFLLSAILLALSVFQ